MGNQQTSQQNIGATYFTEEETKALPLKPHQIELNVIVKKLERIQRRLYIYQKASSYEPIHENDLEVLYKLLQQTRAMLKKTQSKFPHLPQTEYDAYEHAIDNFEERLKSIECRPDLSNEKRYENGYLRTKGNVKFRDYEKTLHVS